LSVDISADGSRIVIGIPMIGGKNSNSGSIHAIYGEAHNGQSGASVAISASGLRIVIGANMNDDGGSNSGSVHVYDWDGTAWIQAGSAIYGETANDQSGASANGLRVAIGAPRDDDRGADSGSVRVYNWDGTAWTKVGPDIDGESAVDLFGWSVAISADGLRIAISAIEYPSGSGSARVYDWDGNLWKQAGNSISGEAFGDEFGYSVAISADGSRIAIGAKNNGGGDRNSGSVGVHVYDWNGAMWTKVGPDFDGKAAGALAGYSVAMAADGSLMTSEIANS
jgi:hypothetical protein